MDMADIDPIQVSNLDIYGNAPLEWSRAREQLARWHGPDVSHFLCTTRPDGQPHVAGVGAMWLDGDLYIVSGDGTRKSKNLAIHPACSIAVRLPGIDVTLEGTAAHVTDAQTLDRVAALYRQLGWPADVDAAARAFTAPFSAPSAGGRRGSCIDSCSTQRLASHLRSRSARRGGALLEVEKPPNEAWRTGNETINHGRALQSTDASPAVRPGAVQAPSRRRPDQSPPRSDRSLTSAPSLR
jgi:hypothetical protein